MSTRVNITTAMSICGVGERTIRRWTAAGRITVEHRDEGGRGRITAWYDPDELLQWNDARDPAALFIRMGIPRDGWPPDVVAHYIATRRRGAA